MQIDWPAVTVRLKTMGRVRCEPGWQLEADWIKRFNDNDLWFVWAGRGQMQTPDGPLVLRPGVCLWVRPGGIWTARQDPHDRLGVTFIHFDLVNADGSIRDHSAPLPRLVHEVDVHFVDAITHHIVQLAGQYSPGIPVSQALAVANTLMTGLLMDLDARSERPSSSLPGTQYFHEQLIRKMASQIAESPKDVPTIAEMADQAGYSPGHFTRIFKETLGQTPQEFTLRAKINRACYLLLESTQSIGQIAQALGYQDIYYFSKQFKQKIGQSPSQYRRR